MPVDAERNNEIVPVFPQHSTADLQTSPPDITLVQNVHMLTLALVHYLAAVGVIMQRPHTHQRRAAFADLFVIPGGTHHNSIQFNLISHPCSQPSRLIGWHLYKFATIASHTGMHMRALLIHTCCMHLTGLCHLPEFTYD